MVMAPKDKDHSLVILLAFSQPTGGRTADDDDGAVMEPQELTIQLMQQTRDIVHVLQSVAGRN